VEHDDQDAGFLLRAALEQLKVARPTLQEIMEHAHERETFVAHVDQDGVVQSITHATGTLATLPELWDSDDPRIERVRLARSDHERLHGEFQKLDSRGFIFDRAKRTFAERPEWKPQGIAAPATVVGATEFFRYVAPASVTLTWDSPADLRVRVNNEQHAIASPFTLDMQQPGQYEIEVVDPRVAPALLRFVVTKGGPPAQPGG
jgi:hypothetical protein